MPSPAAKLGIKCKFYRNTASYASPTWVAVTCISDASLEAAWDEGEANTRETRIKLAMKTMLALGFTAKLRASDVNDAAYTAIIAALLTDASLDLMILNGLETTTGVTGFRVACQVFSANEDQGLGAVVYDEVRFKPTPNVDSNYSSVLVTAGAAVYTAF
jgi:hypothetical protein